MLEKWIRLLRQTLTGGAFACPALLPLALPLALRAPLSQPTPQPAPTALFAVPSGEVVVTEFMKDPATVTDTRGEWIELYNALPYRVNLEGWAIADDGGSVHVLSNGGQGIFLRPGQYFVLGRSLDPLENGGIQVDYVYSSFTLSNGADQILLVKPSGRLSDRVDYDDVLWPSAAGRSISLTGTVLDSIGNDDPSKWCLSTLPLNVSNPDTGTPGQANEICP